MKIERVVTPLPLAYSRVKLDKGERTVDTDQAVVFDKESARQQKQEPRSDKEDPPFEESQDQPETPRSEEQTIDMLV